MQANAVGEGEASGEDGEPLKRSPVEVPVSAMAKISLNRSLSGDVASAVKLRQRKPTHSGEHKIHHPGHYGIYDSDSSASIRVARTQSASSLDSQKRTREIFAVDTDSESDTDSDESGGDSEKERRRRRRRRRRQAAAPSDKRLPRHVTKVLKRWLLSPEHYDYPYPDEENKAKLIEWTGITVKQLNTWFTNARKRIWAPKRKKRGEPIPEYLHLPGHELHVPCIPRSSSSRSAPACAPPPVPEKPVSSRVKKEMTGSRLARAPCDMANSSLAAALSELDPAQVAQLSLAFARDGFDDDDDDDEDDCEDPFGCIDPLQSPLPSRMTALAHAALGLSHTAVGVAAPPPPVSSSAAGRPPPISAPTKLSIAHPSLCAPLPPPPGPPSGSLEILDTISPFSISKLVGGDGSLTTPRDMLDAGDDDCLSEEDPNAAIDEELGPATMGSLADGDGLADCGGLDTVSSEHYAHFRRRAATGDSTLAAQYAAAASAMEGDLLPFGAFSPSLLATV